MVAHDYLVDQAKRAGKTVASDVKEGVGESKAALDEARAKRRDRETDDTEDDDNGGRLRQALKGASASAAERLRSRVSSEPVSDHLGNVAEEGISRRERARRAVERVRESEGINLPEGFMNMGARREYDAGEWPAGRPSGPPLIGLSDGFRESQPGMDLAFRTGGGRGRGGGPAFNYDMGTKRGGRPGGGDMFAEYGPGGESEAMFGGWGGFEWGDE